MPGPQRIDLNDLMKQVYGLTIGQTLAGGSKNEKKVSLTFHGTTYPAVQASLTDDKRLLVNRSDVKNTFRSVPEVRQALD